jgi:hypothetical protein
MTSTVPPLMPPLLAVKLPVMVIKAASAFSPAEEKT